MNTVIVKELEDSSEKETKEVKYKEYWPSYKHSGGDVSVRWMAKVDLYYLNGTTNCIKMVMPVMPGGREETHKYLKSYACELARLFLPVHHFEISLGSIDEYGIEKWSRPWTNEEVPLGKVWVNNWPLGMRMEPQKIKDGRWIIDDLPENKNKRRGPYPFPYNEPHEIVEPKIY